MGEAGYVKPGDPSDYSLVAEMIVLECERCEEGQRPVGKQGCS